jgi:hypothetical protein
MKWSGQSFETIADALDPEDLDDPTTFDLFRTGWRLDDDRMWIPSDDPNDPRWQGLVNRTSSLLKNLRVTIANFEPSDRFNRKDETDSELVLFTATGGYLNTSPKGWCQLHLRDASLDYERRGDPYASTLGRNSLFTMIRIGRHGCFELKTRIQSTTNNEGIPRKRRPSQNRPLRRLSEHL